MEIDMAASDYWKAFMQAAKRSSEENAAKQNAMRAMIGASPISYDYNIIDFARDASPVGAAINTGSALREGDYKKAALNAALLGAEVLPIGKLGGPLAKRVYNAAVDSDYRSLGDILGKPTSMPARAVGADVRLTPRGLVGRPRDEYLNYYGGIYLPDLIKAEKSIYSPDIKIARHDTTRSIDKPLTIKEIMRPSKFNPNAEHKLLALNVNKQNANIAAGFDPNAGLFVTRLGDDLGSQKATSKTPLFVSYSVDDTKDLDNVFYSPELREPVFQPMPGSAAWEAFIPPSQMEKIYNPLDDIEAYEKFLKMKRGKK